MEALRSTPDGQRLRLAVAAANAEWLLGRNDEARRRLQVILGELPAEPSADRIRLRLALTLTALSARDLGEAARQISDALGDARAIGDPVFEAAALAATAVVRVSEADGPDAAAAVDESSAALDRLSDEQLTTRLPGLWMQARARHGLGQFEAALADLERGVVARRRHRPRERRAAAHGRDGGDADRAGAPRRCRGHGRGGSRPGAACPATRTMLLWAQSALASARLAAGDVQAALRARNGRRRDRRSGRVPCGRTARLVPGRGAHRRRQRRARAPPRCSTPSAAPGCPLSLPVQVPPAAADLAEAQIAAGDLAAAETTIAAGEAAAARRSGTPWAARRHGARAREPAAARGEADEAVRASAAARERAADAPLLSARALLMQGRALAAAGRQREAVEALVAAESALDGFGARRRRDEAVRELRRLGHRVVRAADGDASSGPLAALTAREREIAELVAAGRTTREVADQLVLSPRTIESHLRNIYSSSACARASSSPAPPATGRPVT